MYELLKLFDPISIFFSSFKCILASLRRDVLFNFIYDVRNKLHRAKLLICIIFHL